MAIWRLLAIAIWLRATHASTGEPGSPCVGNKRHKLPSDLGIRLTEDVVPLKYVIAISPDMGKEEFHGAIEIQVSLSKPKCYIALHSKNLTIRATKVYAAETCDESSTMIPVDDFYSVEEYEMMVIEFPKAIVGEYAIRMNYSASMVDKINGFYISKYKNTEDNSEKKLSVTQFEPTYARSAFPCFDEPIFKSEFHIRVVYPSRNGYQALSNMPVVKTESPKEASELTVATFSPSLPMSTYLVAFVVSDFVGCASSVDSMNGAVIPVGVHTRAANKHKASFALDVATQALEFYMNIFGIDYPLPKIDLVAIPDFAAGAMENWGLVTFRETEILYSPNDSSCANEKSISLTVTHELAHMWFGNLVTLEWWDDLWLNEGFATYMELVATDFIFPEWNQMANFALETKYVAMRYDSKISSHPIVQPSEGPDEIGQLFDDISYQKGAAIIRMLEDAMGTNKFVHGIRKYLATYRYRNAETRQLFEVLQEEMCAGVDVKEFMDTWTKLAGFPIINVERHSDFFRLSQERFTSTKSGSGCSTPQNVWTIPIKYVTSNSEDGVQSGWFLSNATCVELALGCDLDWIKLNHGSVGYYIVNYTAEAWNVFTTLLSRDYQALDALDRADLLHDAFTLADATDLSYHVALDLTAYLPDETVIQPWVVATNWLNQMERLLRGTDLYPQFQCYAQTLVDTIYKTVGWEICLGDSFIRRELRMVILRLACIVGHKDCLANAMKRLEKLIRSNGIERPHPDVRFVIYSFGLIPIGDDIQASFNKIWELFLIETDAQEKDRLMIGLTSVRCSKILKWLLEKTKDESLVRRQNFFEALVKMAVNPEGLDTVWDFIRNNWERLVARYTLNDNAMGEAVGSIVSAFKDTKKLDEVKAFFEKYPDAGAGANARKRALEEAANNINWLATNKEAVGTWLKENGFDNVKSL